MEKADNVYVLPSEFGWSDLGTWASIYEMADKDYVGNAVIPSEQVMMYDSSNCMVNVPRRNWLFSKFTRLYCGRIEQHLINLSAK